MPALARAILAVSVMWRPCRSTARASGPGTGNPLQALTSLLSWREPVLRGGHGECLGVFDCHVPAQAGALARAAITRKARIGSVGGETVLSVVTPDDFASEAEAQLAAEQLIRKL